MGRSPWSTSRTAPCAWRARARGNENKGTGTTARRRRRRPRTAPRLRRRPRCAARGQVPGRAGDPPRARGELRASRAALRPVRGRAAVGAALARRARRRRAEARVHAGAVREVPDPRRALERLPAGNRRIGQDAQLRAHVLVQEDFGVVRLAGGGVADRDTPEQQVRPGRTRPRVVHGRGLVLRAARPPVPRGGRHGRDAPDVGKRHARQIPRRRRGVRAEVGRARRPRGLEPGAKRRASSAAADPATPNHAANAGGRQMRLKEMFGKCPRMR